MGQMPTLPNDPKTISNGRGTNTPSHEKFVKCFKQIKVSWENIFFVNVFG